MVNVIVLNEIGRMAKKFEGVSDFQPWPNYATWSHGSKRYRVSCFKFEAETSMTGAVFVTYRLHTCGVITEEYAR